MKKNRMMRLASVLLVLCLLTTSVISGTFAKYVTEVEGTDSARVARWGFTGENADIAIGDLFKEAYDKNVGGYADVIAPGTTNSATILFEYSATGDGQNTPDSVAAPEVAYTFTVDTAGSICDDAIKANKNIKWAVYKTGETPDWSTWDSMIAEIKLLSGDNSGTKTYAAQQLPPICEQYTIAWTWDFDANGDVAVAEAPYNGMTQNQYDTYMGNMGELDDVIIKIKITATQVD